MHIGDLNSSIFLNMGGTKYPLFLHITIYIEHMINLVALMFGCSLLEMWALTSVKGEKFLF